MRAPGPALRQPRRTLAAELSRRWVSPYGIAISTIEALIVVWLIFVLWRCGHPAVRHEDDPKCADLAIYLELTITYYTLGLASAFGVLSRPESQVAKVSFGAVLVSGYVLVGWGLFIVACDFALQWGTCKPLLFNTAALLSAFRALHTNLVECHFVMRFLSAPAREPAMPAALEATLAAAGRAGITAVLLEA